MTSPDSRWHIRPAEPSDYDQLATVEIEADKRYLDTQYPEMAITDGIPAHVAQRYAEQDRLLVASFQHQPIGFVAWHREANPRFVGIAQISVLPAFGQAGVGSELLRRVLTAADEDDQTDAVVLVTQRDVRWNGPWYARFGFEIVDPHDYEDWMTAEKIEELADGSPSRGRIWMMRSSRPTTSAWATARSASP